MRNAYHFLFSLTGAVRAEAPPTLLPSHKEDA